MFDKPSLEGQEEKEENDPRLIISNDKTRKAMSSCIR